MAIENIGVGISANDGSGDSIRDAFIKTNNNFSYLDTLTKNLVTSNLTANGNVSLTFSANSYWSGNLFLNGIKVATEGTVFTGGAVAGDTVFEALTQSSSTSTGAVQIYGGLAVVKNAYIGNVFTYNMSASGTIGTTVLNSVTGSFTGGVGTGDLTISGAASATGNITVGNVVSAGSNANKRNVASYFGYFQEVTGTLQTAAQPNITSLGTLTGLGSSGAVVITDSSPSTTTTTGALIVYGGIGVAGNLYIQGSVGNAIIATGNVETLSNALVRGNVFASNVSAGVGTFGNATVNTFPSNFHVPNKGYVNSLVVAFAIGLGS